LLVNYKNQLSSYWVNLNSVSSTISQIEQKNNAIVAITVEKTKDLVVFWWLHENFVELEVSLSSATDEAIAEHSINELNYYVNGWNESSADFKRYPFISYARYNISGTNKDYPAEIWVDYDIPGETTYTEIIC
jgi:hypothetical protein